MAVLGVLFIVLALVLAGAGFWVASSSGAASSTVTLFNNSLTLNPLTMMAMGAIATLLLLLGLWLMTSAGKRRFRSHRERRSLEKTQEQQERELAETRAKLAARDGRPVREERGVRQEPASSAPGQVAAPSTSGAAGGVGRGARADGTYEAGDGSASGLSREEEVRRAAERRADPDVRH